MESTIALIIAGTIFALGIISTMLPILPGPVIVFTGIVIHKLWMGPLSVTWQFVGVALAVTVLAQLLDTLGTWWGAKYYGATWKGALGAILGGIAGAIFFSLPGLILGPVVGAILFELLNNRPGNEAMRAGWGTIIGGLLAFAVKLFLAVSMAIAFWIALP